MQNLMISEFGMQDHIDYSFEQFDQALFKTAGTEGFSEIWEAIKLAIERIIESITRFFQGLKTSNEPTLVAYIEIMNKSIASVNAKAEQMSASTEIIINTSNLPSLAVLKQWTDLKNIFQLWTSNNMPSPSELEKIGNGLLGDLPKLKSKDYPLEPLKFDPIDPFVKKDDPAPKKYGITSSDGKIAVDWAALETGNEKTIIKVSKSFKTDDNYYAAAVKLFDQYKEIKTEEAFFKKYGSASEILPRVMTRLKDSLTEIMANTAQYDQAQVKVAISDIRMLTKIWGVEMSFIRANRKFDRMIRKVMTNIINQCKKQINKTGDSKENKPGKEKLMRSILDAQIEFSHHPLVLDYQAEQINDQVDTYLELSELACQHTQPALEGFKLGCLVGNNLLYHEHPDDWKKGMEEAEDGIFASIGRFFSAIFKAIGKFFSWIFGKGQDSYESKRAAIVNNSKWFSEVLPTKITLPAAYTIDMSTCVALETLKKLIVAYEPGLRKLNEQFPTKEQYKNAHLMISVYFDQSIWKEFESHIAELKIIKSKIDSDHKKFLSSSELKGLEIFGATIKNDQVKIAADHQFPKESDAFKIELKASGVVNRQGTGKITDTNGYLDLVVNTEYADLQKLFAPNSQELRDQISKIRSHISDVKSAAFGTKENSIAFVKEARPVIASIRILLNYYTLTQGISNLILREMSTISARLKSEISKQIK